MCVKVAAAHFRENPMLNSTLPQEYVGKIVKLLPIDLPLELVAHLVEDEDYWKRRSLSRWKKVHTASHGNSWKQTYFEKNLQENIECFDPVTTELVSLERLLRLSKQYVRNLTIRQLPSHLDLELIFKNLREALTSLSLTYGMRNVGMDYDRSLFGMKLSDCRLMAKALESSETLTHLDLSNNLLDDDKVRMVCSGLVDNISVIHLDLSKNKICGPWGTGYLEVAGQSQLHHVSGPVRQPDPRRGGEVHGEGAEGESVPPLPEPAVEPHRGRRRALSLRRAPQQ